MTLKSLRLIGQDAIERIWSGNPWTESLAFVVDTPLSDEEILAAWPNESKPEIREITEAGLSDRPPATWPAALHVSPEALGAAAGRLDGDLRLMTGGDAIDRARVLTGIYNWLMRDLLAETDELQVDEIAREIISRELKGLAEELWSAKLNTL